MKYILTIMVTLATLTAAAQDTKQKFLDFKLKLESDYRDPEESILAKSDLAIYKGLPFFEYDEKFVVEATFTAVDDGNLLKFATSTTREAIYKRYGFLDFSIDGKDFRLTVFRNPGYDEKDAYKDYLFLPFTDLTNGDTSYGAGRYMDLKMPLPEKVILDFNSTYNPYCAYSNNYSCPYPPMENHLEIAVEAGIKAGLITK